MKLQRRRGNHARDGSLDRFGDDRGLSFSGGQQHATAAIENRPNTHSDRPARHFGLARKQRGVLLPRCRRQRLHPSPRTQRRQRLVEANMAGFADAEQLEINPANLLNKLFVVAALCIQVRSGAVRKMRPGRLYIHAAEQMFAHVMVVGMRIGCGEPHVFIEVKGRALGKIEFVLFVALGQVAINVLHRFASGQAENQLGVGSQIVRYDLGS